jgi:hypothetical protein
MRHELPELRRLFFKRLAFYEQGGCDKLQIFGFILDNLILTLFKQPSASREVTSLLDSLPGPIIAEMREYLPEFRHSDGGWQWPPVGGKGSHGVSIPGPAQPDHVKAYDLLVDLLEARARSST